MRNIIGAFVVFGETVAPVAILLEAERLAQYQLMPEWKRNRIMFGAGVQYALPATTACMENIALNYVGPWEAELKGLCATIALGKPIGNQKPDGGLKVAGPKVPRKPPPAPRASLSDELAKGPVTLTLPAEVVAPQPAP